MYDFEKMDKRYIIFANIFLLSNRLQTVMDSDIEELTAKQWLTAMMLGMFDEPPTLKQLAKICDSSHQNTKQLISKLESKGFIRIENDNKDLRAMRILTTDKWVKWNQDNNENSINFITKMFENLTDEEIAVMNKVQQKIYENLENMEENLK
ncbi:MarR family transcriptional regulator [Clostridium sp. KNHs214]|uniref:MarR family winged helix-turn-helix transcriptional regulator n=1 Tax=Clostridium sp. KNHs214 TaxID=1540257 RepID=UPI000556694E|nr:MarR family transcriptional regulator [Clostridium sp. KNHs214]